MNCNDLSPEMKERALACKTADEIVSLAKEEGVELSEEQLEAIAGGNAWDCDADSRECRRDDGWC